MLSILKHKHKQKQYKTNIRQERIAANIAGRIILVQKQWAMSMQSSSERLSRAAKKFALTAFCLISGSYSIYLMTGRSAIQPEKSLSIAAIQPWGYSGKTPNYRVRDLPDVNATEDLNIKRILHYIESLSQNQQGKKVADSIVLSSPGLKDSIALVEKLYQLQSSKK